MTQAMGEFGGEELKIELVDAVPRSRSAKPGASKATTSSPKMTRAGRTFDDAIAWRSGFLDLMGYKFTNMKIHDVPYRALLPERLMGC